MCKCLLSIFKKKQTVEEEVPVEPKFKRKRPGPIITNAEDLTSVKKEKKKTKTMF